MNVEVAGISYEIEVDIDDDGAGVYQWRGRRAPACPACGELLEDPRRHGYASVTPEPNGSFFVDCECGHRVEAN